MKTIDEVLHENPDANFFMEDDGYMTEYYMEAGILIDHLEEAIKSSLNNKTPKVYIAVPTGEVSDELGVLCVAGKRLKGVRQFIKNIGV